MTNLERQLPAAATALAKARQKRDDLICQAVGEGVPYRKIAQLAGVSLGQVQKLCVTKP